MAHSRPASAEPARTQEVQRWSLIPLARAGGCGPCARSPKRCSEVGVARVRRGRRPRSRLARRGAVHTSATTVRAAARTVVVEAPGRPRLRPLPYDRDEEASVSLLAGARRRYRYDPPAVVGVSAELLLLLALLRLQLDRDELLHGGGTIHPP